MEHNNAAELHWWFDLLRPMHSILLLFSFPACCFAWMATRHELSPDRITLLKQKRRAKKKARKQRQNAEVLGDHVNVDGCLTLHIRPPLLPLQHLNQSQPTMYRSFLINLFNYHQQANGKHLDMLLSIFLYPPWQQQQQRPTSIPATTMLLYKVWTRTRMHPPIQFQRKSWSDLHSWLWASWNNWQMFLK